MKTSKLLLLVAIIAAIVAFFAFDLGRYFNLAYLKSQQDELKSLANAKPLLVALAYSGIYITFAALSLPAAGLLSLFAGALFGWAQGTLIVAVSATIGATLAFLSTRFLFRDSIQAKFSQQLKPINDGVEKDGAFYLFGLRLVPVVPFFLINTLMGLTPIKTLTFFWVSLIGMIPGTMVFVNAGQELSKIDSLKGILSPGLIASFALLAVFPWIAKKIMAYLQARKVYAAWPKPKSTDNNIVVIGAGSAGLVTSYIAAAVKAKVTLIERHKMGGDCLNTGCVPSKALIRTATLLNEIKNAQHYGIAKASAEIDFAQVMRRVKGVVDEIEPHDSVERYSSLGVNCVQGSAKIVSPFAVEVTDAAGKVTTHTTQNIVIAAGARPFVPPIKGIETAPYVTSDTVWDLKTLPKRLLVLGGGPIGSELAQCFSRLGSAVTQVEMAPRLLIREDEMVSAALEKQFKSEGIAVLTKHKAVEFTQVNGEHQLLAEHAGQTVTLPFDVCLVAVGRTPNISGYGLETLGIPTTKTKTVETNEYLQTLYPNIYACGDVAGPYQFTHTAAHQAWYASVNALFGPFKTFKVDYRVIPAATFTEPEVARVGLNENDAKAQNIAYEVTHYGIDDLDRAIADGAAHGFVRVLTVPGKDKILGVTIVGAHAGDLLAEYVLAMKHNLGLNKILGTIHTYPTMSEANKYAAGLWKKAHAPEKLLTYVAKFHAWRRG
jgi:pyruvate/2-oxoglutarate dehydrogenase complex dihydrolipoamide dehydrogenase (E3) component/uncharacterized membrane protein YdjX (TVP38/TMEM64 family)